MPFLRLLKRPQRPASHPSPVINPLHRLHQLECRPGVRRGHWGEVCPPSAVLPHQRVLGLQQPVPHLGAVVLCGFEVRDVRVVAEEVVVRRSCCTNIGSLGNRSSRITRHGSSGLISTLHAPTDVVTAACTLLRIASMVVIVNFFCWHGSVSSGVLFLIARPRLFSVYKWGARGVHSSIAPISFAFQLCFKSTKPINHVLCRSCY